MAGGGTGYPHNFRCARCKVCRDLENLSAQHAGMNVVRTGRETTPRRNGGRAGWRSHDAVLREYRCLDCGHVGWSKHPEVALVALGTHMKEMKLKKARKGPAR